MSWEDHFLRDTGEAWEPTKRYQSEVGMVYFRACVTYGVVDMYGPTYLETTSGNLRGKVLFETDTHYHLTEVQVQVWPNPFWRELYEGCKLAKVLKSKVTRVVRLKTSARSNLPVSSRCGSESSELPVVKEDHVLPGDS